jgi:hypothetical protein
VTAEVAATFRSSIAVPAPGERLHGSFSSRLVALGRASISMVRKSNRPGPRSAALSGSPREYYVPNDFAVGRDLIVVAGFACGLKHEIGHGQHHAIGHAGSRACALPPERQCREAGPDPMVIQ